MPNMCGQTVVMGFFILSVIDACTAFAKQEVAEFGVVENAVHVGAHAAVVEQTAVGGAVGLGDKRRDVVSFYRPGDAGMDFVAVKHRGASIDGECRLAGVLVVGERCAHRKQS